VRLFILAFALLGCTPAASVPAAPPVGEVPAAQVAADTIDVCVLHQGKLLNVRAQLLPSRDTMVAGRPFSVVYADTGQYAATREWYVNNEPIDYDPQNVCYIKYGMPRYVAPESLVRLGEWRGVPVFRERTEESLPGVIYVPVYPGCQLQPYQYMTSAPPVACPQPYEFTVP
jgi:hypothetical protein